MSETRRYQVWWRASGDQIIRASNPEQARQLVMDDVRAGISDIGYTTNCISIEGYTVEPEETNP